MPRWCSPWTEPAPIPKAHRRTAGLVAPVNTPQHPMHQADTGPKLEKRPGGCTVTWPAHVKVQQIPGIERTDGQRADLYVGEVTPGKPGSFLAEWHARRQGSGE